MRVKTLDDSIVLMCAFRYALGRRTYVVSSVSTAILDNWHYLDVNERKRYHEEIKEAIDNGCAGDEGDVKNWKRILNMPVSFGTCDGCNKEAVTVVKDAAGTKADRKLGRWLNENN